MTTTAVTVDKRGVRILERWAPDLRLGLQNLLAHDDFFGAVAIRQRRERGADRIANAFLQQNG